MSLVERGRVRRRARTILAYSRAAASVLTIAPLVAVPLLSSMIDGYSAILLDRPEGNLMLGAAAIMLITGLLSIQRISRIDTLSGRGGT
jgi:Flp pilus assembly protein TadB